MAKSKRKNRKPETPSFYEAIPAMSASPVGLPQISVDIDEALQTFREVQQELTAKLRPLGISLSAHIRLGLRATYLSLSQSSHRAVLAARYGSDAVITYAPSLAADALGYGARIGRRLRGPRARAIYLMTAAGASFALVAVIGVTSTATIRAYANDISSPAALLAKKKVGTTILDRNGEILFQGYGAQSTALVKFNEVPAAIKHATVVSEDPGFYEHPGFSWRGTARAALTDISHQSRVEGGSTLTQQLIKNALLTNDKKFERKFKEILLATELERRYSKDEILEMYLNETYYGQGSTGIEAASQTYFHKPARTLSLGESALLAGLPLGPSRFDPNVDLSAATGRRNYVLGRMLEHGKITPAQAEAAKAQPIVLVGTSTAQDNALNVYTKKVVIRAPHFVFYVLAQLREKYGTDVIQGGGVTVRTTLDLGKQQIAEQAVALRISQLSGNHVTNGGLVSLDPKTGEILAMVGSVDYNAPGFGNVNVILSELQPGSSFKPIAYATAFSKGWTGANRVDDTPMLVPNSDGTNYVPQNYDLKFRGSVSLRQALANSLNIPAIKVLQYAGIPETIKTAKSMGITSLKDESRFGLALVLGGGEVRPIDMATVYATLANGGVKVPPRAIVKVGDRYDRDITRETPAAPEAVLDSRAAYMVTNILSDNAARTPEFGPNSPLKLSRPAAAKTGTTNDFRDNWTVGYTPQLVTAVWVGNNDHSPMNNVDGITGAAPIWRDYMEGALAQTPVVDFPVPAGIAMVKVCQADGGLANPWDAGYPEVFKADAVPTKNCASFAPKPTPTPTPAPDAVEPEFPPPPTPIVLPEKPDRRPDKFNPFD